MQIRHMSMPEGMMTMEESKERMMQTAEAMKLRMIQAGRDVSNKCKEWKVCYVSFLRKPSLLSPVNKEITKSFNYMASKLEVPTSR